MMPLSPQKACLINVVYVFVKVPYFASVFTTRWSQVWRTNGYSQRILLFSVQENNFCNEQLHLFVLRSEPYSKTALLLRPIQACNSNQQVRACIVKHTSLLDHERTTCACSSHCRSWLT